MKSILHRSEESRLFAESVIYVSRGFFTSVIKRVFVSLPLAIYIKFLTDSHFTHGVYTPPPPPKIKLHKIETVN